MRRCGVIWLAVLLSACASGANSPPRVHPTATTTFLPSPTLVSPVPTIPTITEGCSYSWAHQGLGELSAQIEEEITNAGVPKVKVDASAYGENCNSSDPNVPQSFSAMQTDFEITVILDDVYDRAVLSRDILAILKVLKRYPPDTAPGPMPGSVLLTFVSRTGIADVSADYWGMMDTLAAHPDGKGLLDSVNLQVSTPIPPR